MSKNYGRAAWLRTQYALTHHAKTLEPLKRAFQDALDWSGVQHSVHSARGGPNSSWVELGDGRQYYVRGRWVGTGPRAKPYLSVRLRGTDAEQKLFNERDVIRCVEKMR